MKPSQGKAGIAEPAPLEPNTSHTQAADATTYTTPDPDPDSAQPKA